MKINWSGILAAGDSAIRTFEVNMPPPVIQKTQLPGFIVGTADPTALTTPENSAPHRISPVPFVVVSMTIAKSWRI